MVPLPSGAFTGTKASHGWHASRTLRLAQPYMVPGFCAAASTDLFHAALMTGLMRS